jgi:hypothetical protein
MGQYGVEDDNEFTTSIQDVYKESVITTNDDKQDASINQDQVDLINRNARKLLEKKNNNVKNHVLKLNDSIKLKDQNQSYLKQNNNSNDKGWTIDQEQNRMSLDEDGNEDTNENSRSLYGLNTQDLRGIKNEGNNQYE